MTSIISPWLYAQQLAAKAQQSLTAASMATIGGDLRTPQLPEVGDHLVGIPEQNGPDSPDNPWFIRPEPTPGGSYARAARIAGVAIGHIDGALALGTVLSADVRAAFSRAKEQAERGVSQLTTPLDLPIAPNHPHQIAMQFDSAKLWLDLASNLISLEQGTRRPPVMQPPVTTLPVGPGEPGSPITIQPIMPPVVQLPNPDSEIQVEAPEAMAH